MGDVLHDVVTDGDNTLHVIRLIADTSQEKRSLSASRRNKISGTIVSMTGRRVPIAEYIRQGIDLILRKASG